MRPSRDNKPYMDHSDLVAHMESLGMDVGDPRRAEIALREVGYHLTCTGLVTQAFEDVFGLGC